MRVAHPLVPLIVEFIFFKVEGRKFDVTELTFSHQLLRGEHRKFYLYHFYMW